MQAYIKLTHFIAFKIDLGAQKFCAVFMSFQSKKIAEIKALSEGEKLQFNAIAVLKSLQKRQAKNGAEFITADFADSTGTINAMCFADSMAFMVLSAAKTGEAYSISGVADFYNGRLSPKLDLASKLSKEEFEKNLENLVETSPFNAEAMKAEILEITESIPNIHLRETVKYALSEVGEQFFKSTAAIKMHHAYMHGLLEHSLKLAKLAVKLLPIYPFVNPSLALAGAILHDIGKVTEYSQGLAADKTRLGILQGHVVLGFRIVRKAGIKCHLPESLQERLEHIILSHQGELEWGAAAIAATPEAVFVSMLDYLDARMGAVYGAIKAGSNAEFSEMVPAIKTRILLTPPEDETRAPKTIYIATSNPHKIEEFDEMFKDWQIDCTVKSANELGGMPTVDEDGLTFAQNALKKARALKAIAPADAYILADDSGIAVDALNGAPGVHSARFAGVSGEGADKANNEKLLKELENVADCDRTARFICALALICPNGHFEIFEGKVEGKINHGQVGENGFGYDPLFELGDTGTTTAELSQAAKNQISHRGKALRKLADYICLH